MVYFALKARFIRRVSAVSNAIETIDNEMICFIIFCLSCIRHGRNAMGVARILQRRGHTDSYIGYSPNCHLNIVGCLLTKRLTKGGSRAPQDPPGYALECDVRMNWA